MDRFVQWLKRPLAIEGQDDEGGHAVEYSLIVAAAAAVLAYALMPATSGLAANIATFAADVLGRIAG
jgi:Flp pilus assembly pilin Flp